MDERNCSGKTENTQNESGLRSSLSILGDTLEKPVHDMPGKDPAS
jgi:hypothetical protein